MTELQGFFFLFTCVMIFFLIGYLAAKWKEYKFKNTSTNLNMARRVEK